LAKHERRRRSPPTQLVLAAGALPVVTSPAGGARSLARRRLIPLAMHTHARGMLFPGDFIRWPERGGLMRDLDEWVLRRATKGAATWPCTCAARSASRSTWPPAARRPGLPAHGA